MSLVLPAMEIFSFCIFTRKLFSKAQILFFFFDSLIKIFTAVGDISLTASSFISNFFFSQQLGLSVRGVRRGHLVRPPPLASHLLHLEFIKLPSWCFDKQRFLFSLFTYSQNPSLVISFYHFFVKYFSQQLGLSVRGVRRGHLVRPPPLPAHCFFDIYSLLISSHSLLISSYLFFFTLFFSQQLGLSVRGVRRGHLVRPPPPPAHLLHFEFIKLNSLCFGKQRFFCFLFYIQVKTRRSFKFESFSLVISSP